MSTAPKCSWQSLRFGRRLKSPVFIPFHAADFRHSILLVRSCFERCRHTCNSRLFKERLDRYLCIQLALHSYLYPHHEQRIPTKIEKVFRYAQRVHAEHLFADLLNRFLQVVSRPNVVGLLSPLFGGVCRLGRYDVHFAGGDILSNRRTLINPV